MAAVQEQMGLFEVSCMEKNKILEPIAMGFKCNFALF